MRRILFAPGCAFVAAALSHAAFAQEAPTSQSTSSSSGVVLDPITIRPSLTQTPAQKYDLPQTTESISAPQIEDTVNAMDAEDSLKYLPSLLLRKRNSGDNQPTLATRTWGINSSARNLVYIDDVPISALIANNNTIGAPRWGMVSPELIDHVDMLYGPFAAAYPGNSMGGVVQITTRMPRGFEATAKQTEAFQDFSRFSTSGTYATSQSSVTLGDRKGPLSWFIGGDLQDSYSQPLDFVTTGGTPAGTTGTLAAQNKTGGVANVVGAGGLLHTNQGNLIGKVAYDITPWVTANYTINYWSNDQHSKVQTYLTNAAGQPTFGGVAGFASQNSTWQEQHLANALSVKSDTKGTWDGEVVFTRYDYLRDIQRSPSGVGTGTNFTNNGTIARLDGTGWSTLDAKGIWRPTGYDGAHEASFGAHLDHYALNNPTYNTVNWQGTPDSGSNTFFTAGKGESITDALWAQDAWKFAPDFKATLGLRAEEWRSYNGYNFSGTVAAAQPTVKSANLSPKAALAWQAAPDWTVTTSFGKAYRYPTVAELYQIVSTGPTFTTPNPNLTPEKVYSEEVAIERRDHDGRFRLSLFDENTFNALISQTSPIGSNLTTFFQNVGETRNRGFEFVAERWDVLIRGLDFSNSITYVDSRIIGDSSFVSTADISAVGKRVPYVPDWRDTVQVTYRPTDEWALTASARYQGQMYSTLDNTDQVHNVYGAFDSFFVVDTRAHYQIASYLSAGAGIDNLFDYKYFLFHPFPGRTYSADMKISF